MYALELIYCKSFNHANALRIMLEGDGYAAVAVEALEGPHTFYLVVASAPFGYANKLYPIALAFATVAGGMAEVEAAAKEHEDAPYRAEMVLPNRDGVRKALREAIGLAADRIVQVLPADEPPTVNHDPGDEHREPSLEAPCPYDHWKPHRDV